MIELLQCDRGEDVGAQLVNQVPPLAVTADWKWPSIVDAVLAAARLAIRDALADTERDELHTDRPPAHPRRVGHQRHINSRAWFKHWFCGRMWANVAECGVDNYVKSKACGLSD